jgi:hypothetical protein
MPSAQIGDRVMALRSADNNAKKVFVYGSGVYEGEQLFEHNEGLKAAGFKNPCIRLDDGNTVYGMECWWGPEEAVKNRFEGFEFIHVSIVEDRKG